MGLFSQLPEEPSEWTGLPSEPKRRETEAERLPDAAPLGTGIDGLFGGTGESFVSISVDVASSAPDAASAEVVAADAAAEIPLTATPSPTDPAST